MFEASSGLAHVQEKANIEQARLLNPNQQLEQKLDDAMKDAKMLTKKFESFDPNNSEKVEEL